MAKFFSFFTLLRQEIYKITKSHTLKFYINIDNVIFYVFSIVYINKYRTFAKIKKK